VDALREFWREWVINYDFTHQTSLSIDVVMRSRRGLDDARLWAHRRYTALLEQARHIEARSYPARSRQTAGATFRSALLCAAPVRAAQCSDNCCDRSAIAAGGNCPSIPRRSSSGPSVIRRFVGAWRLLPTTTSAPASAIRPKTPRRCPKSTKRSGSLDCHSNWALGPWNQ